jgi:PAS domain S-box-containing protein
MRSRVHCWSDLSDRLRVLRSCAGDDVLGAAVLDLQALLHELRLQQLELEMENRGLRAAHEELEASRERHALLYDFAPVGYVTLDACERIEEMNLTAAGMLGGERDALVGKAFGDAVGIEDPVTFRSHLARCLRERQSVSIEVRARPPHDGASLALRLTSTPLARADGRDRCVVALADVTQERLLEQETSRFKDDFLGVVSHELRTPLTAVLGWASMLSKEPPPAPPVFRRGLAVLRRNAEALSHVVEDLIDVSRIVSGQMHMDRMPVRLEPIIAAAVQPLRPAADARSIMIDVDVDPECLLLADGERLQQVVWHLLSNAIKFTQDDGSGRVAIRARRDGHLVRITVRDNGCGIDAEHLPHVFERFRQLDQSTTRSHSGLGLGLAIVRHVVEAHGGHVVAESAGEGRGATMSVELPAVLELPLERAARIEPVEAVAQPAPSPAMAPAMNGSMR